jgi:hypothetical protein
MPKMYRVMIHDADGPSVGDGNAQLGVRSQGDTVDVVVGVAPDYLVKADGNGMSVSICLCKMPHTMVPKRFKDLGLRRDARGSSDPRRKLWKHGEGPFVSQPLPGDNLRLHLTSEDHGHVCPNRDMPISDLQKAISDTRPDWSIDEKPNPDCPILFTIVI